MAAEIKQEDIYHHEIKKMEECLDYLVNNLSLIDTFVLKMINELNKPKYKANAVILQCKLNEILTISNKTEKHKMLISFGYNYGISAATLINDGIYGRRA